MAKTGMKEYKMITNIQVLKFADGISIRTATETDKDAYVSIKLEEEIGPSLVAEGMKQGIDIYGLIWNSVCNSDCILFVIVEESTGKNIGFSEINRVSSNEPTIGITLASEFRGKGYGYTAAKMTIEEGWNLFDHPYFVWELEKENTASRKLVLKLGGQRMNNRCVFSENVIKMMKEKGIDVTTQCFSDTIECYKIERPLS